MSPTGFSAGEAAPAKSERKFELVLFWFCIGISTGAGLLGVAGIWDASHTSPSGEWAGLGVLFTAIVDWPTGLLAVGLAFTQRRRGRRALLLLIGLVLVSLPFLTAVALQHRRTRQRRETEERVLQRSREVIEEQKKNSEPAPTKP